MKSDFIYVIVTKKNALMSHFFLFATYFCQFLSSLYESTIS